MVSGWWHPTAGGGGIVVESNPRTLSTKQAVEAINELTEYLQRFQKLGFREPDVTLDFDTLNIRITIRPMPGLNCSD